MRGQLSSLQGCAQACPMVAYHRTAVTDLVGLDLGVNLNPRLQVSFSPSLVPASELGMCCLEWRLCPIIAFLEEVFPQTQTISKAEDIRTRGLLSVTPSLCFLPCLLILNQDPKPRTEQTPFLYLFLLAASPSSGGFCERRKLVLKSHQGVPYRTLAMGQQASRIAL